MSILLFRTVNSRELGKPFAIVYLLMTIGLMGCTGSSSKDLSRELAKKKIAEAKHLPMESLAQLPSTIQVTDLDTSGLLNRLEAKGLITRKKQAGLYQVFPVFEIELTAKGKQYLVPKKDAQGEPRNKDYTIRMCLLDINDVTGIQLNDDKTQADVHFRLKASELSDFAYLAPNGPCTKVLNSKAEGLEKNLLNVTLKMALFDDGWRVLE